ncbi:MAG TPA: ABC transporter ATP-binding protein [Candidatus Limnocylindrales bacterium]|jgi:ABC-2 type transport system ATP-binding protein|nr:ABC transporter ATP-binding protein [Candidatus Limnocylindrales bacterium]
MQPGDSTHGATATAPILVAKDIHRSYGARRALRSLSFSLQPGRVMGFLGPNGAGKTTAIRVLTTVLEPTSGRFEVDGVGSEHPDLIRRRIGVLPEGLGFPRHTSGADYLAFFGQLYGRSRLDARQIGRRLLDDVGLSARGDSLIETYSHGMRQRLGIARALINDPRVVFLDEPTLGLDPRGQTELLGLVQRIAREREAGVVLSSHLLSEIEDVCDDVVIMNDGQIVAKGTVAEVLGQDGQGGQQPNLVRVRVPVPGVERAESVIDGVAGMTRRDTDPGGWLTVQIADADAPASLDADRNRILDALIRADIPILGFEIAGARLQDVFLRLTAEAIS